MSDEATRARLTTERLLMLSTGPGGFHCGTPTDEIAMAIELLTLRASLTAARTARETAERERDEAREAVRVQTGMRQVEAARAHHREQERDSLRARLAEVERRLASEIASNTANMAEIHRADAIVGDLRARLAAAETVCEAAPSVMAAIDDLLAHLPADALASVPLGITTKATLASQKMLKALAAYDRSGGGHG